MVVVNLVVLGSVLRTMTKKVNQLFEEKKCTNREIMATPMGGGAIFA